MMRSVGQEIKNFNFYIHAKVKIYEKHSKLNHLFQSKNKTQFSKHCIKNIACLLNVERILPNRICEDWGIPQFPQIPITQPWRL